MATQTAEQLLQAAYAALNTIPNTKLNVRGFRKSYDLAAELGDYLRSEEAKSNYHNETFAEDIAKEFNKYANLTYSIERDESENKWDLCVQSTSSSELDDSDDGVLGQYHYNEIREIIEDIQTFERLHYPYFFDEL